MTNHAFRSALDLAAAIREQRLSAANNMENLLARIETLDPTLNTVVTLNAEAALTEAHKADKAVSDGDTLGPLHGVPF